MILRRRREATRLRRVVDNLPYDTRTAMLDGLRRYDRIIVGAYTDRQGGVCPMLAAHRNGGRTSFGTFAKAWDAFTGAKRPRRASAREVRTLRGYLEVALIREGVAPSEPDWTAPGWAERPLADEVRDVQASRRRLAEAEAREQSGITIEELLDRTHVEAEPPGDGITIEQRPAEAPRRAVPAGDL